MPIPCVPGFSLPNFSCLISTSPNRVLLRTGQASGANANTAGKLAEFFVELGWKQSQSGDSLHTRSVEHEEIPENVGMFPTIPSALPKRALDTYNRVKRFIQDEVAPLEKQLIEYAQSDRKWTPNPIMEKLKVSCTREGRGSEAQRRSW